LLLFSFRIVWWQDKFNHIVILSRWGAVSPVRRAAPKSQPFLAAADDAHSGRPPPCRGIQLRSEEIPRLSSKVLSRNFKFRSYAIHLGQIGRTKGPPLWTVAAPHRAASMGDLGTGMLSSTAYDQAGPKKFVPMCGISSVDSARGVCVISMPGTALRHSILASGRVHPHAAPGRP
jgi:hypothetical protein